MAYSHTIRDCIHNFICLDARESEVVDTAVFQRLRGIRQLALANLIYPGAVHTRFEHSLGVCHVAGMMADALSVSGDDRNLLRLAALLHDLGHPPFSHVSEGAFEIYADRSAVGHRITNRAKIHELITQDLLRSDQSLRRIIGQSALDAIIQLLSSGYGEPVLREIISGPLDADKQDYLLRDSMFCGVTYGIFDPHQLLRVIKAREHPGDRRSHLMVSPEGVHVLEQFILAKYYLTSLVYGHKGRMITDQMLLRAIELGVEVDAIPRLYELYRYDGSARFIERYIAWDDSRFFLTFGNGEFAGTLCNDLIKRLRERRLFKRVYNRKIDDLPTSLHDTLKRVSEPGVRKARAELEAEIHAAMESAGANLNPSRREYVILDAYTNKSVRIQSRNDESPILIDEPQGPEAFEKRSTLFRSIDEGLSETFVAVYAPIGYSTRAEKDSVLGRLDEAITRVLAEFVREKVPQD